MLNIYKKYSRTLIDIGLLALSVTLFMLLFTYSFKYAAPVFVAFLLYIVIAPTLKFLRRKGIKLSLATPISLLFFFLVAFGIFAVLGAVLTIQIQSLLAIIPKNIDYQQVVDLSKTSNLLSKTDIVPPDFANKIIEQGNALISKAGSFATSLLTGLFVSISSVFANIWNFVIGVILVYFLCLEIDEWERFIRFKTPKVIRFSLEFLNANVFTGLVRYIKAQLILISCTFIIVLIGLFIASVENAFSIAIIAALLDLLPLLGIPVLFIPWAIYSFMVGNIGFASYLVCLLVITMVFRQIAEPKIAGDSLGVSAFTMLSVMIISLSVFGVAGVIASPLLIIILKALYDTGYLSKWIYLPVDEFEANSDKEEKI